jgi:hypothetical protein
VGTQGVGAGGVTVVGVGAGAYAEPVSFSVVAIPSPAIGYYILAYFILRTLLVSYSELLEI